MEAAVPWERLVTLIEPHYPTGEGIRPAIPLERRGLGPKILHEVNAHLAACGIKIARGTIVDATIIRRSQFDQKPRRQARPGNASGDEGQRVAFWHESA